MTLRESVVASIAGGSLALALTVGGCAGDTSKKAEAVAPQVEPATDLVDDRPFPTAPSEGVGPVQETTLKTEWGPLPIKYRVIDGDAIAEGDMVIPVPTDIQSATSVGRRWLDGIVPYVVSSNLPPSIEFAGGPDRVAAAIAHWEEKTNLRFVKRTTERDYVHFRPGGGCSSAIGQQGGRQFVNLNTAESPTRVAAIGIDRSVTPQKVYYFFRDSFVTAGTTTRTDALEPHARYLPAPGRSAAPPSPTATTPPLPFLVDVGFASNGHLFAWYSDSTVSEGDPSDLALHAAARPFTLAAGKSPADVSGFAIDASDKAYAYYADGTFSVGTVTDLASEAAPRPFAIAEGRVLADFAHVDVQQNGSFIAYYVDTQRFEDGGTKSITLLSSTGTAENLAATSPTVRTSMTGHCGRGETIHEIGHAVGLFHEQTRHDRDANIIIYRENIQPETVFNFEKHSLVVGTDTGAYDFDSIMHYGPTAFTRNGKPTMSRLDGGTFANQRRGLSDIDLEGVRAMYP